MMELSYLRKGCLLLKSLKLLTVSFAVGLSLSGCSTLEEESETEQHTHEEKAMHVNGDIRETTSSASKLPNFLTEQPDNIQTIYAAVPAYRGLLESMPCYCGCGESVGHTSNYDCFVHAQEENGSIEWDNHGTKCGVCLEIAAQAIVASEEGKSVKEIRSIIDETYNQGYADPTPTPDI
ncbi:hypothetical protein M662_01425 [Bacillus sp. SB49]|nr:hypothetical protein M662_01425 [Bacillus sp. SB49]